MAGRRYGGENPPVGSTIHNVGRGSLDAMARPTSRDVVISERLGGALSASQVSRARNEGLTLGSQDAWLALAPLIGPGQNFDVASIRLAAQGFASERLRRVLSNPPQGRAEVILGTLFATLAKGARCAVDAGTATAARLFDTPEEVASAMVHAAKHDYDDALDSHPGTFDSAHEVSVAAAEYLGGQPEPDRECYADEFAETMRAVVRGLASSPANVGNAPDDVLVRSVKAAAALWEMSFAQKLSLGEEDRWRMIAGLALVAGPLVEVLYDVHSQISTARSGARNAPGDDAPA